MTLKHLAALLMLLGALGCQPSDSGTDASGDGGGTDTAAPEVETTAEDAADPVVDEEQLAQVSFTVEGMK